MLTRSSLVSEAEFLSLPETTERVELLDGEVILSPSPNIWHQELMMRIAEALRRWAATQRPAAFVGVSALDVRFAPGRILQPDVFVIRSGMSLDAACPINQIPELCIEILSSNRVYDRLTKRRAYADAGVAEYWVIEPSGVIERWHGLGLNDAEEVTHTLESPLLPGFHLDIAALFAR